MYCCYHVSYEAKRTYALFIESISGIYFRKKLIRFIFMNRYSYWSKVAK